jgi:hypothetical protein
MADLINSVGDYLRTNEVRDMLGKTTVEDEEIGEGFRTPADIEAPEDEQGGGLFASDFRHLQTPQGVPENAQGPVTDSSEIPEGAQTFEGPQGGTYFVPSGEDADVQQSPEQIQQEVAEIVEGGDQEEYEDYISEQTDVDEVDLPSGLSDEEKTRMGATLARAGQSGLTEQVEEINLETTGDQVGVYTFNDGSLSFDFQLSEDDLEGAKENGEAVGDNLEWLVLHELGHAEHDGEVGDLDEIGEILEGSFASTRDGEFIGRERLELVEDRVSDYARTNPGEFVAEVFSGLAMGQEFDEEVMAIYDEYDGPDTWQSYRPD